MTSLGVLDLAVALRELQRRFELESVSGSRRLPDGHDLALRWSGDLCSIERDDGEVVMLDVEAIR